MKRAFTLVEILIVVAIIAVLMAIASPVFWRAKRAAQISASIDHLRQLHLAILLYQQDYEVDGAHATTLPSYGYVYFTYLKLGEDFFRSPCGYVEGIEDNRKRLSYQFWNIGSTTEPYFREFGSNSVLFDDPHCNESAEQWKSPYVSKRGLAVTYGGKLINQFKPGDPGSVYWWSEPEE